MNKLKKFIAIIFVLVVIISNTIIYADDIDKEEINNEIIKNEIVQASGKITNEPKISSRAAVIYDRNSKTVLYNKKMDEKRKMASTTKIMTAIVALENGNLKDIVTISKKSAGTGGSRLGLKASDKITLHDLMYGLMLCSRK